MNKLPRFTRPLVAGALSLLAATALQAQNYTEIGDAGASTGGAQSTGSGGPLMSISGTILNAFDGDFYYINITDPSAFSATTVGGSLLDTMLFLFTMNGDPVYLNDDDPNGASVQSTLPPGHSMGPLTIGTYILGISLAGAEPINASNQNLFADAFFSTDVRGPRAGALGPVAGVREAFFNEAGPYTIQLTGASSSAIPEPSTVALLAFSGVGALVAWRRRARRSS